MNTDRPIVVAGAGSIGCVVGGMLTAGGRRVALLARPRVIQEIECNGLRLTSFEGFDRNIAASQLTLSEDPGIFADAAVVLVTVKSADTSAIAMQAGGRAAGRFADDGHGSNGSHRLGRRRSLGASGQRDHGHQGD